GVRANSQSERESAHGSEAGSFPQHSDAVAKVVHISDFRFAIANSGVSLRVTYTRHYLQPSDTWHLTPGTYSHLSATIGSTRAARLAGSQPASTATTTNTTNATPSVHGSFSVT